MLKTGPRSTDGLRLLVRSRVRLIEQRTRLRRQLTNVEDALFPELKDFFKSSITSPAVRRLLEAFPTPWSMAASSTEDVYRGAGGGRQIQDPRGSSQ